jgi:quinol monooxygenase YgiN
LNTISVRLKVIEGKDQEFLQTVDSLQEKFKQEEGFHKCTVYRDVADESTFHLIEEWYTQDDLDNHLKSDLFRVLIGALKVLSSESEVQYRLISDRKGARISEIHEGTCGQNSE